MNVVQRMNNVIQERRRRLNPPVPQFALGVAPRPTNTSPRLHFCKKTSSEQQPLKPLIVFAAKIPYECLITALMIGVGIKSRHEMIEIQRQSIECIYPPEMRAGLFETLYEKEKWLLIESKCRTAFRNLVSRWLFKRYGRNDLNTEDPATLSEPVQPIRIFDSTARGTYVFEAASLRKSMERDLNYCDWLFPEPSHPKNPLTNLPFHMGHRIYILQQLRSYQQGSWILESYQRTKWNLKGFRDVFLVPLKVKALQEICRNATSEETTDYMNEFIEDHYDFHETHRPEILTVLKWAIKNKPTDPYMLEWLDAFKRYYSVEIIYGEQFMENNHTIRRTLYELTKQLLKRIKDINRLAKLRNETIQERRRQRDIPSEIRHHAEIETIHGPVPIISEFQSILLPLTIQDQHTLVIAQRFELGDINIDALIVDESNYANS
jgi:hypothetical protein